MSPLDWLMIGLLIAGATSGILIWELCRSIAHWFSRPSIKPESDYEQAGS